MNSIQRASSTLQVRALSTRAAGVLDKLDIDYNGEVAGVYDGQWKGSGEVTTSVCPSTGEVLARIRTVRRVHAAKIRPLNNGQASPEDVQETIAKSREAYKTLRSASVYPFQIPALTYIKMSRHPVAVKSSGKYARPSRPK